MTNIQCVKCRMSLRRLLLLAMIEGAGAVVSPSANTCTCGGEHDFSEAKEGKPCPTAEKGHGNG